MSFDTIEMEKNSRYYVDLYVINKELCLCDTCKDNQDADQNIENFCNGVIQMTVGGILVGILGAFSIFFGACNILMPVYHVKKTKFKPCKRIIKSGICIHLQACCSLLAFIIYCALTYSLLYTIDAKSVQTLEGGAILIASFGVIFFGWIFYCCKYKTDILKAKKMKVASNS